MPKKPITAEDLYEMQMVEDAQISPDGRWVAFVKATIDRVANQYKRNIWLAPADGSAPPRQFTYGAKADTSPRWRPDSRALAFVSARDGKTQIYLISLEGGEARPLTSLPNGATYPVWSADGRQLACLARLNAEERRREDRGESDPPPASALEARHRTERQEEAEKLKSDPRVVSRLPYRTGTAYLDDRQAHIYVLDPAEDKPKPRRITDGEYDYGEIAWSPDGAYIYSTQSLRPDTEPWWYHAVVRFSVAGRRRPGRLLTRIGFQYSGVQASPDGKWIAALRFADEGSWGQHDRLVLLPAGGGPARVLAPGLDRQVAPPAWSADARWLYFLVEDRGDTHLYRAGVQGGPAQRVVGGRRMLMGFSLSHAGATAFTANTPERPGDVYCTGPRAGRDKRLTNFNDAWLAERDVRPIEEIWHTAPDGRRIQGWLLRPAAARGRKLPLVVSMHGGPWVMWGPGQPAMWLEWQMQAGRGYAVYFCNPRGSRGYGEEHALVIRNDWGDHVMRDILSGLDQALAQGWADPRRLALTGGSYAGYMTAWIIGHDQRFACAWAQRGLYNLTSFFGTSDIPQLIEREFETLGFDDVQKLWLQSPLAYVRQIRTPLAIEHQDNDWRCPPSEGEQLYAALKRLKREVIMVRYPRDGHEMSRGGEPLHRVDRLNRMADWFDKYCRPARAGRRK